MARRTNEQIARDLAAELGVKLDIESSDPRDYAVEIWAFAAHLNIDGAHTAIPSMEGWGLKSPAAVWAAVADLLENGTECPSDCDCRDDEPAPAPAAEAPKKSRAAFWAEVDELARAEAPAEPTIEELETELAAASAADEAALMSDAAPEVMRAARARFYAAHDALQDARREQHRRDRGYDETAEQAPAAAEQPAAAAEQAPVAAELSAAAAELPPHAALEMALHQSNQLANAALEAAKHTRAELEKFFTTEAGGKYPMLAQAEMHRAAANAYNAARTTAAEAYDALFVFQHPEAD